MKGAVTNRLVALLVLVCIVLAPPAFQAMRNSLEAVISGYPSLTLLRSNSSPRPFEFVDESGLITTLAAFSGRNVLINVWATWCPPCREELPSFDRLKEILDKDSDIAVIALSVDPVSLPQLRAFYGALGIKTLKLYRGDQDEVLGALGIYGLPTTIMLNPQGLEIARLVGPTKWEDAGVIASILRAAKTSPPLKTGKP